MKNFIKTYRNAIIIVLGLLSGFAVTKGYIDSKTAEAGEQAAVIVLDAIAAQPEVTE